MSTTRIYVVINGEERRLVEAGSAAQAIRHCVRHRYNAKVATPKEVASFMAAGFSIEHASEMEANGAQAAPVDSANHALQGTN